MLREVRCYWDFSGAVGVAGSGTYSNGVFTVAGAGGGVWNTADAFNFAYQSISGNSSITTQVTSNTNTNPNAGAGIMTRSSQTWRSIAAC